MIISKEDKLAFFEDLFERAKARTSTDAETLEKWLKQYKGDRSIDGSSEDADVVRNITYEFIESQVSNMLPTPVVSPEMYSRRNEHNAKSVETLINALRRKLPFTAMNDLDERYTYIYGGSVWLVEWDEAITTHNTVGDVKVTCISPSDFVPQPGITNIEDMEYCFVSFNTTKEELIRRYGISEDKAIKVAYSDESEDEDIAIVTVCYFKNEDGRVCEYAWSGDTELLYVDDYYARKRKVCRHCHKRKQICSCEGMKESDYITVSTEYEELEHDITLSDGSVLPSMSVKIQDGQYVVNTEYKSLIDEAGMMQFDQSGLPLAEEVAVPVTEKTRIPYYMPSRLPIVIRKNTSEEGKLFGQSDCEFIRPQQQAINKVESRIMRKLMRAGITPVVPEDSAVTVNNAIFGNVIRMKPGQTVAQYGKIDTTPDISKDVLEAERLYDHAKRVIGISDSYQGMYDASAQSGKAKQLQIQQAAGRLQSKREMKNHAYSEIYRIIFQYYLAYADEPRPAVFKNDEGVLENREFNRYDFIERDQFTGEYYYNDEYIFSAEDGVDYDMYREFLWEENRKNLQSGVYGNPGSSQTLLRFWLSMEKARYPGAHDNVEWFRRQIQQEQQMLQLQQENLALRSQLEGATTEVEQHKSYEDYIIKEAEGIQ